MSEESIRALLIALIPALLVFLSESKKHKTTHSVSVYDKQKDWIEKLEIELDERDREIEELKLTVKQLEERINELERKER